jgi:hypothetical protein
VDEGFYLDKVMQLSFTASLDTKRAQYTIGRVAAHTPWRPADRDLGETEQEIAMRALVREAEEYGADGVVEIAYASEECNGETGKLHRLIATGRAVRLALAA